MDRLHPEDMKILVAAILWATAKRPHFAGSLTSAESLLAAFEYEENKGVPQ